MMAIWFAIVVLTGMVIAIGAASFFLWVELRAMQKSTHTVQYIDPMESLKKQQMQDVTDELKSKLHESEFQPII